MSTSHHALNIPSNSTNAVGEQSGSSFVGTGSSDEEYYSRLQKKQKIRADTRTGRRTRRRSGPGPPDPNHAVPVDLNVTNGDGNTGVDTEGISTLNISSDENNGILVHPCLPRIFSTYSFSPGPRSDAYAPGSLMSQLEANFNTPIPHPAHQKQNKRIMNGIVQSIRQNVKPKSVDVKVNPEQYTSSLTRFLERTSSSIKLPEVESNKAPQISISDLEKIQMISKIKCSNCRKFCVSPMYTCKRGHLVCGLCRSQSFTKKGAANMFRCSKCGLIDSAVDAKQLSTFMRIVSFKCTCGKIVSGDEIPLHRHCIRSTLASIKKIDDTSTCFCEFCEIQLLSFNYESHIFKEHFCVPRLIGNHCRSETIYEKLFTLPLEPDPTMKRKRRQKLIPSIFPVELAKYREGVFELHQIKVDRKEFIWILSFEKGNGKYNAEDFTATLTFEAKLKDKMYRKKCRSYVYPMGHEMNETTFLAYVGKCLPDCFTPTFKFAYTHKSELHLKIEHTGNRFLRRFRSLCIS